MEKRSLFQKIFGGRTKEQKQVTQLKMLNGYTPVFSTWGKNPYEAAAAREAVDSIARNAAKLKAKHIRRVGKETLPVNGQIEKLLQIRPNPNMSAYDFLYKVTTTLYIDNNAFIYPQWEGSRLVGLWPISCQQVEFVEDASNTIYAKFYFADGGQIILPYSEVCHLRRYFYSNDLIGENNKPIFPTLEAIHITNEGLGQAVKSSVYLRGIIKFQGMLRQEDIEANRARFVEEYMSIGNHGGVAALDSKAEYQELKSEAKLINAAQMKELRDAVYRYFGTNEAIVMGNYTETQWDAFYESTIEPIAIQLSLKLTAKLFTEREKGVGNEVVFEANRLQYVSAKTKITMAKELMPLGLFTVNEMREVFNLAPVEGGDKRLQTLNTVDADKANEYQVGKGDPSEPKEDNSTGNQDSGT